MWSLRQAIQAGGLGDGGPVSLAGHVFGYRRARVPRAPDGTTTSMSLSAWAALRNKEKFNLNIIAVGSDSFTTGMWDEVDTLVHRMRQIYGRIDVGVQFVRHFGVLAADANGLDVITTSDEVDDLRETWAVDNGAIDLLIPAGWDGSPSALNGLLGRSKVDGPCLGEKDDKGAAGAAVGLTGPLLSSRSAAHEIGHYLSLEHQQSLGANLMAQTMFADNPTWQAVGLFASQADDVRDHCLVN
jgi:hypothetical protein